MNNIDQLIRLADLFDSRGEHEAAGKIDKMIAKAAPVKTTTTNLGSVFEKLAKVADDLDLEGALKEAAMIDGFISKHAAGRCQRCNGTGYAGPLGDSCDGCDGSGVKTNDDDIEEAFRDEDYHGEDYEETEEERDAFHNLMSKYEDEKDKELGTAAKDEVDVILDELELLEGKKAVLIKTLKKSADYDEFRQPEGDTEQSKRYDSKHHHNLQVREPKRDQERVDREGRKEHHIDTYKPHEGALSSRNCPEHIGDMLGRVGPGIFQCPRDGAIYNWELGYTNFDGVKVPGGSISNQTPDSSGYGASHRIFDSRGKV